MIAKYDNLSYLTDDGIFQWHINNGFCEPYPRELSIVKRYLELYPSCNNTFIDVGGHIGTQSLPYSRLFKDVVAFEPNVKSHNFFTENIKLNDVTNIKLYNKGVFNKTTTCKVVQHSGANSGCYYIKECDAADMEAIEVIRLDDLNIIDPVDFIKIDTEGSELKVLEGSLNLINQFKPLIQLETNDTSEKYFGYKKESIFEFMKQNDYKIFDDDGNNPLFFRK